jgi:hypothetical protein
MAAHETHNTGARRPLTYQVVFAGSVYVGTLAGNVTLTNKSAQYLKLDPGGSARDVTLPAVEDGLFFEIVNAADAAEDLVVKNDAGSVVVTISQNEKATVRSSTSAWVHTGIVGIALS